MALILADRVKETSTTAGNGTFTLAGAATGFQSFAVIGDGNTTFYCIAGQGTNEWEVGIGTYATSGTTLTRTTVLANSSGTEPTALVFSAGTKDVFVTYPSEKSVNLDASGNVGIGSASTGAKLYVDGTATVTGVTTIADGTAAAPSLKFDAGGTQLGLYAKSLTNIGVASGGLPSVDFGAFAGSGNVGQVNIYSNSTYFGSEINFKRSRDTFASPTIVQNDDEIGFLTFKGYDGSAYREAATITSTVDGTPGTGVMPGALNFWTVPDGSGSQALRMKIDQAGNVGIGTSSPTTRLHLQGTGAGDYRGMQVQDTFVDNTAKYGLPLIGARFDNANVPFTGFGLSDEGLDPPLRLIDIGGGVWDTPDATKIQFWTGVYTESVNAGVRRMVIDSDGIITMGIYGAGVAKFSSTGVISSGTVTESLGGTNQTTYTTGDILYASAANTLSKLPAGTVNYVLTSGGAGVAPSWAASAGGAATGFEQSFLLMGA